MLIDAPLVGMTFTFLGEVLIGFTALRVHHRFLAEHKVDKRVFAEMRNEQRLGILGIILLVLGFIINIFVRYT